MANDKVIKISCLCGSLNLSEINHNNIEKTTEFKCNDCSSVFHFAPVLNTFRIFRIVYRKSFFRCECENTSLFITRASEIEYHIQCTNNYCSLRYTLEAKDDRTEIITVARPTTKTL